MKNELAGRRTGGGAPSRRVIEQLTSAAYLEHCRSSRRDRRRRGGRAAILLGRPYLERWAVTDQRDRNTCVAFATASCAEVLLNGDNDDVPTPLSPQFVYWMMRKRYALEDNGQDVDPETGCDPLPPGYETGATRLSQAREVLLEEGICSEELAPYALALHGFVGSPPMEGRPPSPEAEADAQTRRVFDGGSYEIFCNCTSRPQGVVDKYLD